MSFHSVDNEKFDNGRKKSSQTDGHDHDDDYLDYDDDYNLGDFDVDDMDEEEGEEEEGDSEEEGEEEADDEDEEEEESEGTDFEDHYEDDELDENEDGEEEEVLQVQPDEDDLELKERKLSIILFNKEELILNYLNLMKKVRRLREHNLFLQDYLHRLCVRKGIILEEERKSSSGTSVRAANKLKRQQKKQDEKMKANFEVFRSQRPASGNVGPGESQQKPKPTRAALRRARQLQKPEVSSAPEFAKKIETRLVSIHGQVYHRVLRNKTRDWMGVVQNDPKKAAKEVPIGHSSVPVPYHRRILPHEPRRRCRRKIVRQSLLPEKILYNEHFVFRPINKRRFRQKMKSLKPVNSSAVSLTELHESEPLVNDSVNINKKISPLKWFLEGRLKGRKTVGGGSKLTPAERQNLIDFVNEFGASKTLHKGVTPPLRHNHHVEKEWDELIGRLFALFKRHAQTVAVHDATMKEKMVDWSVWERRNLLGVQGLYTLIKRFTAQRYFSAGEKRRFRGATAEFGTQLHHSHTSLMGQLYRMYRGRARLLLLQRALKDQTNQALVKQGYTIADYDLRLNENRQLYISLLKREKDLEAQSDKLGRTIKRVVRTRNIRQRKEAKLSNASKISAFSSDECRRGAAAAGGAMAKYNSILEENSDFLLQAAMVDRPHLLKDFTTRKRAMHHSALESQRRSLLRAVHLIEKELHSVVVRSADIELALAEGNLLEKEAQKEAELREHKERLGVGLNALINQALGHCGDIKDFEMAENE